MQRCIEIINNEHSVDLIEDERAKARIRKCCKEAKHMLTDADEAELIIDSISNGIDF